MLEGWKSEEVAAKDAEIAALKNNYDELIGIGSVPGQEDFEACSREQKNALGYDITSGKPTRRAKWDWTYTII